MEEYDSTWVSTVTITGHLRPGAHVTSDQLTDVQETPTKPDSRAIERRSFRGECFNCGRRGHYAAIQPFGGQGESTYGDPYI